MDFITGVCNPSLSEYVLWVYDMIWYSVITLYSFIAMIWYDMIIIWYFASLHVDYVEEGNPPDWGLSKSPERKTTAGKQSLRYPKTKLISCKKRIWLLIDQPVLDIERVPLLLPRQFPSMRKCCKDLSNFSDQVYRHPTGPSRYSSTNSHLLKHKVGRLSHQWILFRY